MMQEWVNGPKDIKNYFSGTVSKTPMGTVIVLYPQHLKASIADSFRDFGYPMGNAI